MKAGLKIFSIFISVFFCLLGHAQGIINIEFKELHIFVKPTKCIDTIYDVYGSESFKIYLFSCNGSAKIEKFSNDSLIGVYEFFGSNDTQYHEVSVFNPLTVTFKTITEPVFRPNKSGIWQFFKDGKLYKREEYLNGKLVEQNQFR